MAADPREALAYRGPDPNITFEDLVKAYYADAKARFDYEHSPPSLAAPGSVPFDQYPSARQSFESRYGPIRKQFYSFTEQGGVVLLVVPRHGLPPELFYHPPVEVDASFQKILFLADQISIEAGRLITGTNLEKCLEIVQSALAYLFTVNDLKMRSAKQERTPKVAYQVVTDQLLVAQNYYLRAVARRAVMLYLVGMAAAAVVLPIFLFLLSQLSALLHIHLPINPLILGSCAAAGGLGAILSVMIRMSQGQLSVAWDASNKETVIVGAFRPCIGVLSGSAVYILVSSGLLPLKLPDTPNIQAWAFFVAVAFVAGFSERLLTDALVRAEGQILSSTREAVVKRPQQGER